MLVGGGFPLVDGLATSFDSMDKVTLSKYGLTALETACKASGTCDTIKQALFGEELKYIA